MRKEKKLTKNERQKEKTNKQTIKGGKKQRTGVRSL